KATEDRLKSLMMQGLNGDAAAHSRLLSELAVLLRGFYSRRFGGDPSDAEDLVQETLIAVHNRRESYDPGKPFTSWAFSMARYKMIDEFRRRRVRVNVPIDDIEDLFAEDDHEAATASVDLQRLMAELPLQQRNAILQVKVEGLSVEEAAQRSGLSPSNVKISIHRGMKKLIARVQGSDADAN
ncbi:MAG: sigma-70 family RNA polymerase sigma factor, partial [Phenylobacterium sp.]|nr:sigma-70 family RNA polymerase sigma factor [Phenylobacterium sp.]